MFFGEVGAKRLGLLRELVPKARRVPILFYVCKGCEEKLKPLPGDCCVFCSYGSVPCPPVQAGQCYS
jgi:hypothetical protein